MYPMFNVDKTLQSCAGKNHFFTGFKVEINPLCWLDPQYSPTSDDWKFRSPRILLTMTKAATSKACVPSHVQDPAAQVENISEVSTLKIEMSNPMCGNYVSFIDPPPHHQIIKFSMRKVSDKFFLGNSVLVIIWWTFRTSDSGVNCSEAWRKKIVQVPSKDTNIRCRKYRQRKFR